MAGKSNIDPQGGVKFSSTYQPANRRESAKIFTNLLKKNLKRKREIVVQGTDIVTGAVTKIKVQMPTTDMIVGAFLRKAAGGDMNAIRELLNRVEGKTMQQIELGGINGLPIQTETIVKYDIDYSKISDEALQEILNARIKPANEGGDDNTTS